MKTRVLEYVNAAHTPPVIIDIMSGTSSMLRQSCVGVGMLDEMPQVGKNEDLT